MREDYNVTIIESMKELSAKERIRAKKSTSAAVKLDEVVTPETPFIISAIDNYVILSVHNEHAENNDYKVLLIFGDGQVFSTGSPSFTDSFTDIVSELSGTGEDFGVECTKIASRNYKGKFILTCNVI